MNSWRLAVLLSIGVISGPAVARAQFFGNGGFSPPNSVGGYYPTPTNTMFPGYLGNGFGGGYGGYGGYGYGGYGGIGMYGYGPNIGNGPYSYPYGGTGNYGWRSPQLDQDLAASRLQSAAAAAAMSQLSSNVVNAQVSHTGAEIKLNCKKSSGSSLNYWLNGTAYTIQPGYSQTFRDDRNWKLEFYRNGPGTELVSYTLRPGNFNFALGSSGWELRQVVGVQSGELPPAPQPVPTTPPLSPTPQPPST